MKKNAAFLLLLSLSLVGCTGPSNHDDYDPSTLEREIGEFHHIYARYLDDKVGINHKELVYTNTDYNFKDAYEVVVVGKKGSKAIPMKNNNHNGYTVHYKYEGFQDATSIDEDISEIINPHDAGYYTYTFKYADMNDYLQVEIQRALFSSMIVKVPTMEYLGHYTTPYVDGLPKDDDSISVKYQWKYDNDAWKDYNFKESEINTTFDYMLGRSYQIKAILQSRNYHNDELINTFVTTPHVLNKDNLTLSNKDLSFEYIFPTSYQTGDTALSKYDPFISKQVNVYLGDELIPGTFSFVDEDKSVNELGKFKTQLKFKPNKIYHYTDDPVVFDVDVNITKMKVVKPIFTGDSYHYKDGSKAFAYYSIGKDLDEVIYDSYYKGRELIDLSYDNNVYPGTYPVSVSLKDSSKSTWVDGSINSYDDTYVIRKATVTIPALYYSKNDGVSKSEITTGSTIYIPLHSNGDYCYSLYEEFTLYWRSVYIDPDTHVYNYYPLTGFSYGFYVEGYEDIFESTGPYIKLKPGLTSSGLIPATFRFNDDYCIFTINNVSVNISCTL